MFCRPWGPWSPHNLSSEWTNERPVFRTLANQRTGEDPSPRGIRNREPLILLYCLLVCKIFDTFKMENIKNIWNTQGVKVKYVYSCVVQYLLLTIHNSLISFFLTISIKRFKRKCFSVKVNVGSMHWAEVCT